MSLDIKLLSRICETPGVPGYEGKIRDLIIKEVSPYVDAVTVDNMGNVTAFKKEKNQKKSWLPLTWMRLAL